MSKKRSGPTGPNKEMGLRKVSAQSAIPDHAQASGVVPGDDSGIARSGQSPSAVAAGASRVLSGSARIRETIPVLESILATSDEVTDSGVRVRTIVLGGGDAGARRRWINGQIFGPSSPSALPTEPDDDADLDDDANADFDVTAGVRVPVNTPMPSGETGAEALLAR